MKNPTYRHGKNIDVTRLKPNVLENTSKKLRNIKCTILNLSKKYKAVQQKTCYVCGSNTREQFASIHGFIYFRCLYCGHVYTKLRYREDDLLDFYQNDKHYSTDTYADTKTFRYRIDNVARPKMSFLNKFVGKINNKTLLDAGSGIGDIPMVAQKMGWRAIGVEVSKYSVEFGRKHLKAPLVADSFEHYLKGVKRKSIDAVTMIGFLEHTTNPVALLKLVGKVLKDGGYVMIQVPSGDSFASVIQKTFPENVFRHMVPMDHYQLFSRKSLDLSLAKARFTPVGYWFHGLDFYELLNHLTIMHSDKILADGPFYKTIISLLNDFQMVLDKKEMSDRMIVVAKKIL